MAYDKTKDPSRFSKAQTATGRTGRQSRSYPKAKAVTAHDSNDLASYAAGLIVLAAGNLKILPAQNADADPITFTSLAAGAVIPVQTRRVFATGTTATVASLDG